MAAKKPPRTDWQMRMSDQMRRDIAEWRAKGLTPEEMFDVLGDIGEELTVESVGNGGIEPTDDEEDDDNSERT